MVRLIKKYKLSNKNENYYIKEAKQVGTLYHVCTIDAFVNRIIEDNELGTKDNLHSSGKYHNDLLDTDDAVSFTRDSLFVVPTWTVSGADILFQFVIDGDKLSEHYKITPYNGNYKIDDDDEKHIDPKQFEKEEVVIGPIRNFKSYIKEVKFDLKSLGERLIQYRDDIEEIKKYLGSIPCRRKQLPFLQKDWSIDYKKTSKEDSLYKIKTLDDLLKYIDDLEEKISKLVSVKDIRDYIDTKSLFEKYLPTGILSIKQIEEIVDDHPEWLSDFLILSLFNNYAVSDSFGKKLLEKSINKLRKDTQKSLLMHFCYTNNTDIVKFLLDRGVPLDDSLLVKTFEWDNLDVARLLIDYVKDVNVYSSSIKYATPLYYAIEKEAHDLVSILLDKGAKLTKEILYKVIYMLDAPVGKMFDIVLTKGEFTDELLVDAAVHCVGANTKGYLKKLVNKGLDITEFFETLKKDGLPDTCNPRMLSFLLENGFGAYMDNIKSILTTAVSKKDVDTIKLLLESYNDKDKLKQVLNSSFGTWGLTPLESAIEKGNIEIIELFLKYGADTSTKNTRRYGRSILCELDNCSGKLAENIAKLLIKYGAPVDISSIARFIRNNDINVVKLLLENGGDKVINEKINDNTCLNMALNNSEEMVKLLLDYGAEVNGKNKYGYTPLYLACNDNKTKLAKLLLEYGADTNIKAEYGRTPLNVACLRDNIELVKLLLDRGADVNIKDTEGYTPLSWACKYKNTELVKILIEHGADIDMVDTDKISPDMKTLIDKLKGSQKKTESRIIRRLYRR